MVRITSAIMAVLPALAGNTVKAAVKDACDGLKAVIHWKWGKSAPISKAIAAILAAFGRPTVYLHTDLLTFQLR
jgi:D-arabinose 5-phosphate isomerase GutQ